MESPFNIIEQWIIEERRRGAPNPQQAVLSTLCQRTATPHSRVVAIREITPQGCLFFTQKGTRKVFEIENNKKATMTFWLELYQREIILEGEIEPLNDEEIAHYWQSYPREAQIRFYSYAPTSSQPILSKDMLNDKMKHIEQAYQGQVLPLSPYYCGFRLKPEYVLFYAYRTDELSDVVEYRFEKNEWQKQLLSP